MAVAVAYSGWFGLVAVCANAADGSMTSDEQHPPASSNARRARVERFGNDFLPSPARLACARRACASIPYGSASILVTPKTPDCQASRRRRRRIREQSVRMEARRNGCCRLTWLSTRRWTARSARSLIGCRIVVSGGHTISDIGVSSNPVTEIALGMSRPARCNASIDPGGHVVVRASDRGHLGAASRSNSSAASTPDLNVKSPIDRPWLLRRCRLREALQESRHSEAPPPDAPAAP